MAGYNLGEARGKIVLETDFTNVAEAEAALAKLRDSAKQTQDPVNGAAEALDKTATRAGIAGAAIGAGLGLAVKKAADFEQGMSAIKAVSGATAGEMDKINAAALRIGAQTSFSATEAASAMEELVKAGISTKDVLNGAADATVALAAAGGVDLPEAATISANAMNQFGLTAKQLPAVVDTIAGAANASAIDVKQFGYSLSQVGAVAKLAGLSFDDTSVAIAALGNAGIVGSDAGTSLKTFLTNLIPTTKENIQMFSDLGLQTFNTSKAMQGLKDMGVKPVSDSAGELKAQLMGVAEAQVKSGDTTRSVDAQYQHLLQSTGAMNNAFYDQQGNIKSISSISDTLGKALQGMTAKQQQATLSQLFGSDATRAAAVIAKTGAKGFDDLAASMAKTSAADVAKTRLDNLKGSMSNLSGAAETLEIKVGQALIPVLRKIVDIAGNVLSAMSQLPGPVLAVGAGLATMASLLLLGFAGFVKASAAVKTFKADLAAAKVMETLFGDASVIMAAKTKIAQLAIGLFNATMRANPILTIVGLLVGLAAAIVTATGGWDNILAAMQPVFDYFQTLGTALSPLMKELGSAFSEIGSQISAALMPVLQTLVTSLMPPLMALFQALTPLLTTLGEVVGAVLAPVLQLIVGLFQALIPVIVPLLGILVPIANLLGAILVPAFQLLGLAIGLLVPPLTLLVQGLTLLITWLTTGLQAVVGFASGTKTAVSPLATFFSTVFGAIGTFIAGVWNGILAVTTTVWTAISGFFTTVIGAIVGFVTSTWSTIVTATSTAWAAVMAFLQPVFDWFTSTFGPLFTALGQLVSAAWDLIVAATSYAWSAVLAVTTPIWDAIKSAITTAVNAVKSVVTTVWNALSGAASTAFGAVRSVANSVWDAITDAIRTAVNAAKSVVSSVWGTLSGLARSAFSAVESVATSVWGSIKEGISSAINAVKSTLDNVWSLLPAPAREAFQNIYDGVSAKVTDLISFVKGIPGKITSVFSGLGSLLFNAGQSIIQGLIDGVVSMINSLTSKLKEITNLIPKNKGPAPVDAKLLTPAGESIMQSLLNGLESKIPGVMSMLSGLTTNISATGLTGSSTAAGSTSTSKTSTVNLTVNWQAAAGTSDGQKAEIMKMLGNATAVLKKGIED